MYSNTKKKRFICFSPPIHLVILGVAQDQGTDHAVIKQAAHSPFSQGDGRPMRSILSPSYHALSSPNLLTAAVQSRIKSLDPVEPQKKVAHATSQMSGFQLAFLRQIGAAGVPSTSENKTVSPETNKSGTNETEKKTATRD